MSAIERVRMAVAEAGYDPALIMSPRVVGATFSWLDGAIPDPVIWRAREAARVSGPWCWSCWESTSNQIVQRRGGCLATRQFEQDCGVER